MPKEQIKTDKLNRLILLAKDAIRHCLKSGCLSGKELKSRVLPFINIKTKRNRDVTHGTLPIHILAFIRAYKELERNGQIKIARPFSVPFPMTDYATKFSVVFDA